MSSRETQRLQKMIQTLSEKNNPNEDLLALQLALLNIQLELNKETNVAKRQALKNKKRNLTDPRRPVIRKIVGDGRCMFRAFALGDDPNLDAAQETEAADNLRYMVHRIVCGANGTRYEKYKGRNADIAFQQMTEFNNSSSKRRYCDAIQRPGTYAGIFELRILSQFTRRPVIVYVPSNSSATTYHVSAVIGRQYKNRNPAIHLWYRDKHYQLFTKPPRPDKDLVDMPPAMRNYLNLNRKNAKGPGTPSSRPLIRPSS